MGVDYALKEPKLKVQRLLGGQQKINANRARTCKNPVSESPVRHSQLLFSLYSWHILGDISLAWNQPAHTE